MKLKLLLLSAVAVVAVSGCASHGNPFAGSGEYPFTYDMVPEPVPNMSTEEMRRISEVQTAPTVATPGVLVVPGAVIRTGTTPLQPQ
jgi:hypothetical protein